MRSNSLSPISINATEWWLKPIAMLQHNWALIEDTDNSTIVYFLHDGGNTIRFNKLKNGFTEEGIVVDSVECVFRSNWTLIPRQTDYRFHRKLDS